MELFEIVRDALAENVCLELISGAGRQLVEVHAMGRLPDGAIAIRVWQREASGTQEGSPGWRLLCADCIQSAHLTSVRSLAPRLGYRRNDSDLVEILRQY